MHSATKFKCNFAVIGVVHSEIKTTGGYLSKFRGDENCFNSLHKYKDYPKTYPLPQYAQIINFIDIKEFCSGSAVIYESFHNQFEWAPYINGVAAERRTSLPRHRWHRLSWPKIVIHVNSYIITSTKRRRLCFHLCWFVCCLYVCLWTILRKNVWTDFHQIFRIGKIW